MAHGAGGDCAGVVIRCGPHSGTLGPRLAPGDAVFGLAEGSLGSHVLAAAATLARMPAGSALEAVATAPTVFTTADAALRQLANVTPHDRRATKSGKPYSTLPFQPQTVHFSSFSNY